MDDETKAMPQYDVNAISDDVNDDIVADFSASYTSLAAQIVANLPDCRQRSLALTALEESLLWTKQTVALNQGVL